MPEAGSTPQAPGAQKAARPTGQSTAVECPCYHGKYQYVSMDNVYNYGCLLIYKWVIDLFEALKSITALCLDCTLYIKFDFSFRVTAPTQRLRFWVDPRQQSQVVSSPGICTNIITM